MSARPCGKPAGPPILKLKPVMLICGRPMSWVIPLLMPKSAGFNCALGVNVMLTRLKPSRASLVRGAKDVRFVQRENLAS